MLQFFFLNDYKKNTMKMRNFYHFIVIIILIFSNVIANAQDYSNMKSSDWFDVKGNISTSGSFADYSNTSNVEQNPWSSTVNAGLNFRVAGIDIPLNFTYVDGKRTNYNDPFYRYGLSPRYKWLTLHLGYRSIPMSPYLYSGMTSKGVGAEIKLKHFNFLLFTGELNKEREYDAKNVNIPARFKRDAYGLKMAFKSSISNFSLALLKVKDKVNSIKASPEIKITPKDNLAGELAFSLRFLKYFNFRSVVAASILTDDIKDGQKLDNEYADKFSSLIDARMNSKNGYLTNNSLGFQKGNFGINAVYSLISEDYSSLGLPGLGKNVRNTSVNTNLNLFKGKLNFNANVALSKNNLNNQHLFTNSNNMYSLNITSVLSKHLNISTNYNLVNTYQSDGTQKVDPKTQLDLFSHSFNIVPTYTDSHKKYTQNFSLACNYNASINANEEFEYANNSNNITLSPTYSLNINKLDLNVGINYSFGLTEAGANKTNRHIIGVFASQSYFKEKNLSANANMSYGIDNNDIDDGSTNFTFSGSLSYRMFTYHRFSAGVSYNVSSYLSTGVNTGYVRGYIGYNYTLPALSTLIYKDQQKNKTTIK